MIDWWWLSLLPLGFIAGAIWACWFLPIPDDATSAWQLGYDEGRKTVCCAYKGDTE